MKRRTMLLLWLGAAISISEIFTGGLIAPLGFARGLAAILIGHAIGCSMLALGGYISFSRRLDAMNSVAASFGSSGGKLIATLNAVQLVGWTIVMIVQAGGAITGIFPDFPFMLAALALSACVLLWALIFRTPAGHINEIAVILLSVLCAVLFAEAAGSGSFSLFGAGSGAGAGAGSAAVAGSGSAGAGLGAAAELSGAAGQWMSFALALELSIAMPVSWLPLAGDYAMDASDGKCASAMPFIGYFAGSVIMYAFGLAIGVSSDGDVFSFIASSRFRLIACGVVVLSTLTTAFLDLYSAAAAARRLSPAGSDGRNILVFGLFAAAASIFFPVERYSDFLTEFLTGVGMVFIPVYTVLFTDFAIERLSSRSAPAMAAELVIGDGTAKPSQPGKSAESVESVESVKSIGKAKPGVPRSTAKLGGAGISTPASRSAELGGTAKPGVPRSTAKPGGAGISTPASRSAELGGTSKPDVPRSTAKPGGANISAPRAGWLSDVPWLKFAAVAVGMAAYRLFGAYEIWIPTLGCMALVIAIYAPARCARLGRRRGTDCPDAAE